MAFLLAEDKFLTIKQAIKEEHNQPEDIQELMLKLLNDLKICDGILLKQEEQAVQEEQEEQAAQSFILNWNFPMIDDDDDEHTILYRSSKAITPDLPTEEPDNSLSMEDEHLSIIPETESDKVIKSSVEDLFPIPSESKGIFEDICDVPFCDNDHFDAEFGLINSLLSRDISITSPKIDFLPGEFTGELDLIDPILPGIYEDDFDKEEGEIDIDILQIEDEILREKLLNVILLIDKIKALNLTPSTPFVLKYPSFSPIPVMDSGFLIEEVDTFLVSKDSIPPGIESDFDSERDIIFLDDLLTINIPPPPPRGGEIVFSPNVEDDDSFTFFRLFSRFSPTLRILLYFSPPGVKTPFLTPASPLRTGGISSGWNFHDCPDFEDSRAHGFVHSYIRASYPQLHLGNPIS
ncbi:hypothetical protein Tco_0839004 [Tanacetum coccineum]|uniref:Reverse transcriptase domain-containing protein n=1 Tax=Tanacetum coccineum TaxID=301880 RepID=A0ABQ5ASL0_9ASTR